jgi:hypothetical protein
MVTASMKWLRPAILRLRALGIDFAPLLAECGITLAGLADPHGRLGNAAFMRGWQLGESLSGEPAFGVLAASGFDFRQFELINSETEFLLTQLFASSPTLGSGLSRMCHYYPLHHDTAQLRMDKKAGVVTLRHVMPSEARPARAFIEWAIAVLVKEITDIAVRPVALIQVRFAHERPLLQESADPYRQYLGANVQFSAADNAIVLAESDLAIGLRTAKPLLMPLLERRAQALMGEQSVDVLIADRIRTYLTSMMGKGVPPCRERRAPWECRCARWPGGSAKRGPRTRSSSTRSAPSRRAAT